MAQEEEENFAEGKVPSVFTQNNAAIFTLQEVKDLLETHLSSKQNDEARQYTPHPMMNKTLEYVQRFSQTRSSESSEQMRTELYKHNFEDRESAVIINLMPETAEEARALLPSLNNHQELSDEVLQKALDELQKYRKFD